MKAIDIHLKKQNEFIEKKKDYIINEIKQAMFSQKLTYRSLAKKANISTSNLQLIINRNDYNYTIDTLLKLSFITGIKII